MPDRTLVVDDERNIRFMLAETLATMPMQVDTASSGEEALELLRQHRYRIVLLDLKMPGMDGIETLRLMKETSPDLPVIILTAHGTIGVAVEAMKLGATDFIQKPFDPDQLRKLVRRVIDRQGLDESKANDYASYFELAKKCVGQGQLDAAVAHLHKAIGLAPERPEAFNMLGAIQELRRNVADALKQYRIALELDRSYGPARKNLDRAVMTPLRAGQIHLGELKELE